MVAMEWTPRLESAFKRLQDRKKSTSTSFAPDETKTAQEVDAFLADPKTKECVDLDLVKRVSALLLKYSSSTGDASGVSVSSEDWIHTLVKGSTVYVPKAAPKERSPELEKLMDTYKSQLASKEYSRMISSIDPISSNSSTLAYSLRQDMKDLKDVKAHTIGIVNVLYTGAAVFTAVFMISAHFTEDLGMRVLLSFLAFVGIVACEAYLYHRHAQTATGGSKVKRVKPLPEDVIINTTTIGKEKYA
ncbi:hypothetical protein KI688_006928 [Linnemannia hyalina]|uniref:Endoplasmic reticulum-based factor for assembly of V-ATPase n=1 Tax=Linnemannia hyalina TaxID=64524 RepID=A0A9P7XJI8_9FUNG|nr:hypothetical protein KI688_006928 [Linnemannia hyalina]